MRAFSAFRAAAGNRDGFTLIELMVVMTILSIMAMVTVPRLARALGDKKENFAIMTGLIAKTFDDSFLNNKTNYLIVHLKASDPEDTLSGDEKFLRRNGISVVNNNKGVITDSPRKLLRFRQFPESFRIDEVMLPSGEKVTDGNVFIPFYPQGYADDAIVHVTVNGTEQWSVRIYKHMKEPKVVPGFIAFENLPYE